MTDFELIEKGPLWCGKFQAMASPCELLIETDDRKLAMRCLRVVYEEAKRIEQFWSRYRQDNIIHKINTAEGAAVKVDSETAELLDLAEQLWQLSDGKFDITSGLLRKAWKFDCSDNIPHPREVEALMPLIGWDKVEWKNPYLRMLPDMQLDFGGIGKEYAVDSCLALTRQISDQPMVINLGGDIQVSKPRNGNQPWHIGLESSPENQAAEEALLVYSGAIATSGDAYRYLEKDGRRYSHVLDATTGWPVENAPSRITVIGSTCSQAGILSSLALLQGTEAEAFLAAQDVRHFVQH